MSHILIDRRWLSNILDVRFFRVVGCHTDHCLLVAKVKEILAVSKQAAQAADMEGFNLGKLNELEVRKQYQIKISNSFAALENLNDKQDINRSLKNIKENIKTTAKEKLGLCEMKQRKQWFGE